jgi:hypothetical protein
MRTMFPLCLLLASLSAASADPLPPRMRQKEERLRKIAEEKKRLEKNPFDFSAPDGFTVTAAPPPDAQKPAAEAAPDFAATSVTPAATMTVVVETGAVTVDETLLADQAKKLTEKFAATHAGGSARVLKKEIVKVELGPATRVLLETRADAKKGTKPLRELHYLVGNATHHAHVTYATGTATFGKLEKKFDESLRKTKVAAAPAPAQAAAQ